MSLRVMLVDEHDERAALLEDALVQAGYRVAARVAAGAVQTALADIRKYPAGPKTGFCHDMALQAARRGSRIIPATGSMASTPEPARSKPTPFR